MEDPDYFRQKAEQCRRLARTLIDREVAREALLALAAEMEAKATALEPGATADAPTDRV
jgi:hypothetical protein